MSDQPADVRMPRINQEVDRWHLETFPQILAVVDRDGDVWTRDPDAADGDGWVWRNELGHLAAPAPAAQMATAIKPAQKPGVEEAEAAMERLITSSMDSAPSTESSSGFSSHIFHCSG